MSLLAVWHGFNPYGVPCPGFWIPSLADFKGPRFLDMIPFLLGLATDTCVDVLSCSCCSQVTQAVGETWAGQLAKPSFTYWHKFVFVAVTTLDWENGVEMTLTCWLMCLDIYYIFRIAFIWIVLMKFMILYERCLCAQVNREVIHISLELQDFEAHLSSSFINRFEYSTAKPSQRHLQIHCIHNLPAVWSARAEPVRHWAEEAMASMAFPAGSSIDVPWRYSPMQEAEIFNAADSHEIVWTCLNLVHFVKFCQCIYITRK